MQRQKISKETTAVWLALCFLLLMSSAGMAQQTKIRVVVQDASIRAEPSIESDALTFAPLGSVMEAIKKIGAWYEVKVKSSMGIAIFGYIHEMYVEIVEKPTEVEQAPPPEKEAPPNRENIKAESPPQKKTVPEKEKKNEQLQRTQPSKTGKGESRSHPKAGLALMGGMISGGASLSGSTSYSAQWNDDMLSSVSEQGSIRHDLSQSKGFGLSFHYLFLGGLGLQVRADLNSKSNLDQDSNKSTYNLTWSWESGSGPFDRENEWNIDGGLSLSVYSLNLIFQLPAGRTIAPYVSGGISYFSGDTRLSTNMGFAFSYTNEGFRRIEYLILPATVDSQISGIGFNIGGGMDLKIVKNLAIVFEAVYFNKSKIDAEWAVTPNTYTGIHFPDVSWIIDEDLALDISATMDSIHINPSFFKVQGGLKLVF